MLRGGVEPPAHPSPTFPHLPVAPVGWWRRSLSIRQEAMLWFKQTAVRDTNQQASGQGLLFSVLLHLWSSLSAFQPLKEPFYHARHKFHPLQQIVRLITPVYVLQLLFAQPLYVIVCVRVCVCVISPKLACWQKVCPVYTSSSEGVSELETMSSKFKLTKAAACTHSLHVCFSCRQDFSYTSGLNLDSCTHPVKSWPMREILHQLG